MKSSYKYLAKDLIKTAKFAFKLSRFKKLKP